MPFDSNDELSVDSRASGSTGSVSSATGSKSVTLASHSHSKLSVYKGSPVLSADGTYNDSLSESDKVFTNKPKGKNKNSSNKKFIILRLRKDLAPEAPSDDKLFRVKTLKALKEEYKLKNEIMKDVRSNTPEKQQHPKQQQTQLQKERQEQQQQQQQPQPQPQPQPHQQRPQVKKVPHGSFVPTALQQQKMQLLKYRNGLPPVTRKKQFFDMLEKSGATLLVMRQPPLGSIDNIMITSRGGDMLDNHEGEDMVNFDNNNDAHNGNNVKDTSPSHNDPLAMDDSRCPSPVKESTDADGPKKENTTIDDDKIKSESNNANNNANANNDNNNNNNNTIVISSDVLVQGTQPDGGTDSSILVSATEAEADQTSAAAIAIPTPLIPNEGELEINALGGDLLLPMTDELNFDFGAMDFTADVDVVDEVKTEKKKRQPKPRSVMKKPVIKENVALTKLDSYKIRNPSPTSSQMVGRDTLGRSPIYSPATFRRPRPQVDEDEFGMLHDSANGASFSRGFNMGMGQRRRGRGRYDEDDEDDDDYEEDDDDDYEEDDDEEDDEGDEEGDGEEDGEGEGEGGEDGERRKKNDGEEEGDENDDNDNEEEDDNDSNTQGSSLGMNKHNLEDYNMPQKEEEEALVQPSDGKIRPITVDFRDDPEKDCITCAYCSRIGNLFCSFCYECYCPQCWSKEPHHGELIMTTNPKYWKLQGSNKQANSSSSSSSSVSSSSSPPFASSASKPADGQNVGVKLIPPKKVKYVDYPEPPMYMDQTGIIRHMITAGYDSKPQLPLTQRQQMSLQTHMVEQEMRRRQLDYLVQTGQIPPPNAKWNTLQGQPNVQLLPASRHYEAREFVQKPTPAQRSLMSSERIKAIKQAQDEAARKEEERLLKEKKAFYKKDAEMLKKIRQEEKEKKRLQRKKKERDLKLKKHVVSLSLSSGGVSMGFPRAAPSDKEWTVLKAAKLNMKLSAVDENPRSPIRPSSLPFFATHAKPGSASASASSGVGASVSGSLADLSLPREITIYKGVPVYTKKRNKIKTQS